MLLIATGGYSKVYCAFDSTIVKKINLINYEEDGKDSEPDLEYTTIRELAFLNLMKHPNIVSKISQSICKGLPCHVDIKLKNSGVTLSKWASDLTIEERGRHIPLIAFQVIKALYYLELNNMVHADIKPSNVLIDPKTMHVTLIDFGGVLFNPSEKDSTIWCSTKGFRPPEHLRKSNQSYVVNSKNDIFSFALTMFCCLFDKYPNEKYIPDKKYDLLSSFKKDIDDLCNVPDITILKILYTCLNVENKKRPKASDIYNMKYFSKFRKEDTFEYSPVKISIPEYNDIHETNEEYKGKMMKIIKKISSLVDVSHLYCHSLLLLDKILSTIDLTEIEDTMREYIAVFCVHVSYLLFDNSKSSKEYKFYEYEDYNNYFVDLSNLIFPALDFNVYQKIY